MHNSGKVSCCGRGGSWFKNCGGVSNTKRHHTWAEGIQACKTRIQFKAVIIGQQLKIVQQKGIDSSQGAVKANYKPGIVVTKTFAVKSVNTSIPMSDILSIVPSTYMSDNVYITIPARTLTKRTSVNALIR